MRALRVGVCIAGVLLVQSLARAEPRVTVRSVGAANPADTGLIGLRVAQQADLPMRELGPLTALPRYELDLTLRDDLGGYTLNEELVFTNNTRAPLADVVLRLFGNSGSEPLIQFSKGSCADRECRVTQPSPSVLRVEPDAPLRPGAVLHIRLQLNGSLRVIDSSQTDMLTQGLSSISSLLSGEQTGDYGLLSVGEGIASLANFYAVVARRKAGNWISGEQKTLGDLGADGVSMVRVTLRAPRNVTIASSGVVSENLATGDALHRTQTINASLVRDFALFASRDFRMQTKQVGDVTVRAYGLARDAASNAQVLDTAAQALRVFERRFGPYPYSDLDVVEAPLVGGAGGAEFSGIISVASMLYRPLTVDKDALKLLGGAQGSPLEFTTAHEIAHQYWYGLVGSDARESPFVDESLTQWSAMQYFEDRFGAERANQEGDAQVRMNYRLMRLLGTPDGAVNRPVDAFDSTLSYAGLVYGKGAYMYGALRKLCGDAAFFGALREYARQYRFQEAPATALIDSLAKGARDANQLRGLATRWLEQSHGDEDLGGSTLESMLSSVADSTPARGHGKAQRRARPAVSNGLDLGGLEGLMQSLVGNAGGALGKRGGNASGPLDARALKGLLGQLQGSGAGDLGALNALIGGLMQQVDKGIDQLPMPER